ncbi:MAG: rhodanese-like domain-containing protein [Chitinophagaceae bacterium]|jgi:rhodanese-related sulfurtransferase|nr:rhodanese-like domain-containing protein [Chitinophagaceae bacterium]
MFQLIKKLFQRKQTNYALLLQQGAVVVDVRSPDEYRSGHIKGSTNIPLNTLGQQIASLKKKGKPIITVCRSGARSGMAKSMLLREGIDCYNGGAWTSFQHKIANSHVE